MKYVSYNEYNEPHLIAIKYHQELNVYKYQHLEWIIFVVILVDFPLAALHKWYELCISNSLGNYSFDFSVTLQHIHIHFSMNSFCSSNTLSH